MAGPKDAEDWEVGDNPTISPDAKVLASVSEPFNPRSIGRERYARRIFAVTLAVILGLGLAGVFGVRASTTKATRGAYDLRVTYPKVTRAGLPSPLDIEVTRTDGSPFEGPITVAISSDYLSLFDQNTIYPRPASETGTADSVVWEFDAPPRDSTFSVQFDMSVEPAIQWGQGGFVRIIEEGSTAVEAHFYTWVAP